MDVGVSVWRLRSSHLTLPETVRCGVDTVRRLLCLCVEAIRQLLGPTQGDAGTAIDLIRRDPQALLNYLPHPLGRKEAIVAADERFRPHIGPTLGWPGVETQSLGLTARPSQRLFRDIAYHVVPEPWSRKTV